MAFRRHLAIILPLMWLAGLCLGQQTASLSSVAESAVSQSKLTLPGSTPFHLKATIVETTNPSSEYRGEIEQYWAAPDKWRRTIESPDFSQTIIVNGDKTEELNKGDYFPWWLKDLVTALFDPVPMLDSLKQTDTQIQKPHGDERNTSCARMSSKELGHMVFCFQGSRTLPESIFTPWFSASYKDYKEFHGKHVARKIVIDPEPGTAIELTVTSLSELKDASGDTFEVKQPTARENRLEVANLSEASARKLLVTGTEMKWPTVGGGLTKGRMAVYISADRTGKVREAWPHGSDNADLQDFARDEVRKWRFKPITVKGTPAQLETLLTFDFETTLDKTKEKPFLSEANARKQAIRMVNPRFSPDTPKGPAKVRVAVAEDGKVAGVNNFDKLDNKIFLTIYGAVTQWIFRPYLVDGKAVAFDAELTFHVD